MNDSVGTLSSLTSLPQTSCYIPRASLSSRSTTSSSDSIKSYDFLKYHPQRRQSDFAKVHDHHSSAIMKWNKLEEGSISMPSSMTSISSLLDTNKRTRNQFPTKLKNLNEKIAITVTNEGIHESSSSLSQESSSNSLHSMTSLLLNVQNLAKHSAIANNNEEKCENHWMFNQHQSKSKDLDQVSIASSTHFTLVNGCGRDGNIKTNSSFCRHDRKITILTMTMTLVFIIGIIIAIYFMEQRARSMPSHHQ